MKKINFKKIILPLTLPVTLASVPLIALSCGPAPLVEMSQPSTNRKTKIQSKSNVFELIKVFSREGKALEKSILKNRKLSLDKIDFIYYISFFKDHYQNLLNWKLNYQVQWRDFNVHEALDNTALTVLWEDFYNLKSWLEKNQEDFNNFDEIEEQLINFEEKLKP